jgi:hypothetical protein
VGKWLIGIGLLIVFGGIILYFFGDKLGWMGSLPGDISVEKENFSFYFPITTMIIISVILSILLTLIARFFRS